MGVATTLIHDQQGNETLVDSAYGFTQYFETRRRVYSGAVTGTPLSTTTRCYNGTTGDCTAVSYVSTPIMSIDTQTSLNGGGSSRTVQIFNASHQPTELFEYDYGATNPTKHTLINYADLRNNILDRPLNVTIKDGGGNTISQTRYEYDGYSLAPTNASLPGHDTVSGDRGNLTAVHRSISTNGPMIDTYYHYDDAGQVVSSTDGRGKTTDFAYDPSTDSCLNSTTPPTPSSGISQSFTQVCDPNTSLVTSSTDPNGTITTYGYDSMLRRSSIVATNGSGTGSSTTIAFSGGTLPETITTTVKATPNPDQVSTKTLDPYGRISSIVGPDGATVLTTYDSLGRVGTITNPYFSTSDPTYGVTGYAYDALNRMTRQCQPDNGNGTIVPCVAGNSYKEWTYSGNAVSERDERGNSWQRTIDAFGNVTAVIEPGNLQTNYSYNGLGDLTDVTQHGITGEVTRTRSFKYDFLSHLLWSHNPESGVICYGHGNGTESGCQADGYDGNGNVLYKTDARGALTTYLYDDLNRLLSKTYSGGSAAATRSSCYQYDSATNGVGRLGAEWTQTGSCPSSPPNNPETRHTIVRYDAMGRIKEEQQCHRDKCSSGTPTTSTMHYDLAGNLTYYSNGIGSIELTQNYNDAAGRLQSITSSLYGPQYPSYPATLLSVGAYSPIGSIHNMNLGPVINVTRTYDNRLRTTGQTVTHP
jgi:YD repeat-containing protein